MSFQPLETELKFKIAPEALEPLLAYAGLQGEERRVRLRSIYFDTPERDLRRCAFVLRVRDTGDGFVQTVKHRRDACGFARGEWETAAAGPRVDHHGLARTPAASMLDGKLDRLGPVFETTFERRTRQCRLDGALIEAAFDRGEISTGDRREPIFELELELKSGDPAALFALGRRLAAEFSARLSFESKSDRGYRLADNIALGPVTSEVPRLGPDLSAREAFQRIARACLAQVCANADLLRTVQRPEAVHQMRIGLRRLKAALAAFKPMLRDPALADVKARLDWLAGELDMARGLDVFIQDVFRPAAAEIDDASLASLGRRLLEAQTTAYDRMLAAVRSTQYAVLLVDTAGWIEAGPWSRCEDAVLAELGARAIDRFAVEALDRLRHAVRRRCEAFDTLDAAGRHRLRIGAKRLRYAAEFFDALFDDHPKVKAEFLAALERMQDRLGLLNDIAGARAGGLDMVGPDRPDDLSALGRVVARRGQAEPALLAEAAEVCRRFHAAAPFWRDPH